MESEGAPAEKTPNEPVKKRAKKGEIMRPVRRKALVKAVIESQGNMGKAAAKLGMTREFADSIARDVEFKDELKKALEKYNIGVDRFAAELDRGLKEGKPGSHVAYLEMYGKLLGLTNKEEKPSHPGVQVNLLFNEAKKRGLA